jgi:SAM-dependent methyltransferase
MGIGSDTISLMISLKKAGHFGKRPGSVMELGRQQLANSFLEATTELIALGEAFGVSGLPELPKPLETHIAHGNLQYLRGDAPDAAPFWKWLGYRYAAIDVDNSEGVLALDLNYDSAPREHIGKYDLVTNFGTTEHLANQLQAFKVIHDLTAPDGIMIHSLPAGGMINHGLVNYNPKFFAFLSRSNRYRTLYFDFRSYPEHPYSLPDHVVNMCAPFEANYAKRSAHFRIVDGSIVVALQKVEDMAFVPPLDVPAGTKPFNRLAAERYWTVFSPPETTQAAPKGLLQRWLKKIISGQRSKT